MLWGWQSWPLPPSSWSPQLGASKPVRVVSTLRGVAMSAPAPALLTSSAAGGGLEAGCSAGGGGGSGGGRSAIWAKIVATSSTRICREAAVSRPWERPARTLVEHAITLQTTDTVLRAPTTNAGVLWALRYHG